MLNSSRTAILIIITATIACAAPGAARPAPSHSADVGTSTDVLAGAELSRFANAPSVVAALKQARPWFLNRRGTSPLVSIDGSPATDLSSLSMIRMSDVREVRLLHDRQLVLPNGDVRIGDVILVSTRRD